MKRPTHAWSLPLPLVLLVLLAACRPSETPVAERLGLDPAALPGTYAGRFECRNCPGIDVALWLRADGTFFLRQDYLGDTAAATERVHKLGRWSLDAGSRTLTLESRGPALRFAVGEDGVLTLQGGPTKPQRLGPSDELGAFADRVRVEGEYTAKPERFVECVTALSFGLEDGPGQRELRRRHRDTSRPETPALVELEARFAPGGEDAAPADPGDAGPADRIALAVERVVAIKPNTRCAR